MSSPEMARGGGREPAPWPRDYGHLQRLAARYAQARLAGHAVVNRASGRTIRFDWLQGLRSAVAPGTAPELLLAVPSLPSLLAKARPLGASDDPRRRHDVRRVHGFAASVEVARRPISLWLLAREDKRGLLSFDGVVPRSPLVAPREDGGDLPDLPGARTRALRMVLARGAPVRRQDGGDTPDDADDQSETTPAGADASPDAAAPDTAPPSQAPDPTPKPNEAPGATPSATTSASGTVDMNGLFTPEGRLDREAIFYRQKARLAELQAKNLDPKTDPEYRQLLHLFAQADRDRDEGALSIAVPEAGVETEGANALEAFGPWIERKFSGLFSRNPETEAETNAAAGARSDTQPTAPSTKPGAVDAERSLEAPSTQAPLDKAPESPYGEGWKAVPDWTGYPDGLAKPEGSVNRIVGPEYRDARRLANNANRRLRNANKDAVEGMEVHEIKPVYLGGDPVDPGNKVLLTPSAHDQVHAFWTRVWRALSGD